MQDTHERDNLAVMSILESGIKEAGSVGKLADLLGVRQNVISNWRSRGIPRPWAKVIEVTVLNQRKPRKAKAA